MVNILGYICIALHCGIFFRNVRAVFSGLLAFQGWFIMRHLTETESLHPIKKKMKLSHFFFAYAFHCWCFFLTLKNPFKRSSSVVVPFQ